MKIRNMTTKAFTLAEVLITLSIIGVVAALTIPTLIQRTGNEELVSRLMKSYSTLSQATETIMTENGSPKIWALDSNAVYNIYKEHLRNAKDCSSGSGCFYNGTYKYLNRTGGEALDKNSGGHRNFVLSDGTAIQVDDNVYPACDSNSYGSYNKCGFFRVDINGKKAPNQFGRDLFFFSITPNGLVPWSCDEDGWCNGSKDSGIGYGCACKIIAEGDMNY